MLLIYKWMGKYETSYFIDREAEKVVEYCECWSESNESHELGDKAY